MLLVFLWGVVAITALATIFFWPNSKDDSGSLTGEQAGLATMILTGVLVACAIYYFQRLTVLP